MGTGSGPPGAERLSPQARGRAAMQPTGTASSVSTEAAGAAGLTATWDNATGAAGAEPDPAGAPGLLLLALLTGGALLLLLLLAGALLLLGRRCGDARRAHRALEEVEKGTGAYVDSGQHAAPDAEAAGEDTEGPDTETERFLSTCGTGRRVSFNEAALFEQSRKTQDKGRRYTLTEGDFHHLKNARLSHLPPLQILTIPECDPEAVPPTVPPETSLAIFQPAGKALPGRPPGPSSALPGGPYNPASGGSPSASSGSGDSPALEPGPRSGRPGARGQGSPVLRFFCRLRRHASLDGASPRFSVKKWKVEAGQRASSLDTRGSPKRHHFQRQRAASESAEPEGEAPCCSVKYTPGSASAFPAPSAAPALGRIEPAEAGASTSAAEGGSPEFSPECGGPGPGFEPLAPQEESDSEHPQTASHDIWSLRASLELHAAASDHSSSGNDRDSVRSGDSSGSGGPAPAFPPASPPAPRAPPDAEPGPRRLLQMDSGYASIEGRGAGEDGPPLAPHDRRLSVPGPAAPEPPSPRAWPRRPRRDYSVDEKTDALFHEFLRHDPHFDDTPQARHRARAPPHRKQWHRGRQHSDPGARSAPPAPLTGAPRAPRAPLRRGDSVDCPPDSRAPDDQAGPAAPSIAVIEEEPGSGAGPPLDKLATRLDSPLPPAHLGAPPSPLLASTSPEGGPP